MRTDDATVGALLVGALAVICCAGPLIVAAIGTTALAAWLSKSAYLLVPAAIIAAGTGVAWVQRRRVRAEDCCPPERKASHHE